MNRLVQPSQRNGRRSVNRCQSRSNQPRVRERRTPTSPQRGQQIARRSTSGGAPAEMGMASAGIEPTTTQYTCRELPMALGSVKTIEVAEIQQYGFGASSSARLRLWRFFGNLRIQTRVNRCILPQSTRGNRCSLFLPTYRTWQGRAREAACYRA